MSTRLLLLGLLILTYKGGKVFSQVKDFSVTHGDLHSTLMLYDWGGLKSGFVSLVCVNTVSVHVGSVCTR